MRDVVFIAVTVGFFGLAAAYIGACARIIGREEPAEIGVEPAGEPVGQPVGQPERVGVVP